MLCLFDLSSSPRSKCVVTAVTIFRTFPKALDELEEAFEVYLGYAFADRKGEAGIRDGKPVDKITCTTIVIQRRDMSQQQSL